MATTVLRRSNLDEAGCGLKLGVEGKSSASVEPDVNDPWSQGSAMVTPNVRARLRAICERGGR